MIIYIAVMHLPSTNQQPTTTQLPTHQQHCASPPANQPPGTSHVPSQLTTALGLPLNVLGCGTIPCLIQATCSGCAINSISAETRMAYFYHLLFRERWGWIQQQQQHNHAAFHYHARTTKSYLTLMWPMHLVQGTFNQESNSTKTNLNNGCFS